MCHMKDNIKLQKALAVIERLEAENKNYKDKINILEQENDQLREQVRLLLRLKFEKKTEKNLNSLRMRSSILCLMKLKSSGMNLS